MYLSAHEFWTVAHGMLLGAVFLLSFAGGLAELWANNRVDATDAGRIARLRRLRIGLWTMTVACWLTVVTGTFQVYVWYRERTPDSPRSRLLADPAKALWHTFGMEWKEHVAWISPMLTTSVLFIVLYYGGTLASRSDLRRALIILYVIAFAGAAAAGMFGAFINKIAPIM